MKKSWIVTALMVPILTWQLISFRCLFVPEDSFGGQKAVASRAPFNSVWLSSLVLRNSLRGFELLFIFRRERERVIQHQILSWISVETGYDFLAYLFGWKVAISTYTIRWILAKTWTIIQIEIEPFFGDPSSRFYCNAYFLGTLPVFTV